MFLNKRVKNYSKYVVAKLGDTSRYTHTLDVLKIATDISVSLNVDVEKTQIAALFHDYTKYLTKEEHLNIIGDKINLDKNDEYLMHGYSSSILIKHEFGINDSDILEAIKYHTTGKKDLCLLGKIIFIADYASHDYDTCIEVRKLLYTDFDKAMRLCLEYMVNYIKDNNLVIHKDLLDMYNEYINVSRN